MLNRWELLILIINYLDEPRQSGLRLIATALYLLLPVKPPLTPSGGLLSSVLTLIAALPGFFIAALAAVATFNRTEDGRADARALSDCCGL